MILSPFSLYRSKLQRTCYWRAKCSTYLSCWIRLSSDSIWPSRASSSRCTSGRLPGRALAAPSSYDSRVATMCSRVLLRDRERRRDALAQEFVQMFLLDEVGSVRTCSDETNLSVVSSAFSVRQTGQCGTFTFVESMSVLVYCLVEELKRPNWQTDLLLNSYYVRYQGLGCVFYTW